jgi:hypothetical protein
MGSTTAAEGTHPPACSVIDGGKASAGQIVYSQDILEVTGGKAKAPETSLEQLKSIKETTGVLVMEIGGAEAAGAILRLNGKLKENDPVLGGDVSIAVCELCLPAMPTS